MNVLETRLCDLILKNPLILAAGCGGHSDELSQVEDFNYSDLGAFVTKGVTLNPKVGNQSHRIAEVSNGMLNSIGLQNRGLKYFMEEELPRLEKYNIPIIVNLAAGSVDEFETLFNDLMWYPSSKLISGVEINVSCPNVHEGGISLGVDPLTVELIVNAAASVFADEIIITKLTPNVTNIVEIADAAISGGTDAISMINTVRGCAVNIENKQFVLGRKFGGMSGPAIKPIGLLAVHECFTKIKECNNKSVPIIGIGGIINYRDVIEYILVGASAVQIGTGLFLNHNIFREIGIGLEKYLEDSYNNISELIGVIE